MGVMLTCPHVFDVALCRIKGKNAARSLSLVGHPCTDYFFHNFPMHTSKEETRYGFEV